MYFEKMIGNYIFFVAKRQGMCYNEAKNNHR